MIPSLPRYCPDCQQPLRWAVTAANSKRIALDPEPDPEGNQAAYPDEVGTLRTRQLRKDEKPLGYERRYMPHVASCPAKRPPAPLPANVIPINRNRTRGT